MKIAETINQAVKELKLSETPVSDAEILMSFVLSKPRNWVIAHGNEEISPEQKAKYQKLVSRRINNEPIAYIISMVKFGGREFYTTSGVLIPRPESEQLVELVLKKVEKFKDLFGNREIFIADVGTGAGNIAITLDKELKRQGIEYKIIGSDVSAEAIEVAKKNSTLFNSAVDFRTGNLLEPFNEKIDILVANLPYIPHYFVEEVSPDIKYFEPNVALDGGTDGTKLIKEMILQAKSKLSENSLIFLEIWHEHGPILKNFIEEELPGWQVEIKKDLAGFDRFVFAKKALDQENSLNPAS